MCMAPQVYHFKLCVQHLKHVVTKIITVALCGLYRMYQFSRCGHLAHIKSHLNLPVRNHGDHKSQVELKYP